MLNRLYALVTNFPKSVMLVIAGITVFFAFQLPKLHWETDARVFLPKGHAAILYDERVDEVFGVKDAVIIGIVNEKEGIFNPKTLARIARITEKISALPGVIANRTIDVASLSTATVFTGTESELSTQRLMETVPTDQVGIERLKSVVYGNSDLFVGNIVSKDGTGAMIRAKLKEGIANRYQTYWQIKGILAAEQGGGSWGGQPGAGGGNWQQGKWPQGGGQGQWQQQAKSSAKSDMAADKDADVFYMAGRPVIEVSSGFYAMQDMKVMIPLLIVAIMAVLFIVFKTLRGVVLPLLIMAAGIIWTMGTMAALNVPLYTISTMLPVILVAVAIGNAVHLLTNYYDNVLSDPYREGKVIVGQVLEELGPPLITTSLTTAIGFLSLLFSEMPPFKTFGLFTVLGIVYCWLLSVTFLPAALCQLKPKVGGYLAKRRAMRVHAEQDRITRTLVGWGEVALKNKKSMSLALIVMTVVGVYGATLLHVDSSWMSDFKKDSEVALSNDMLNKKFDGTIFLNVVVEGKQKDALKSLAILKKIEALQNKIEGLPYVGDSLSVVDYLKSMNKTLHADAPQYNVLPASQAEVAEDLFLFSISGQPELLNEVIDYDYRQANVTFFIKTDHTGDLKVIIDGVNDFVKKEMSGLDVEVNLAGSANNSYIWAELLIKGQGMAIVLSKLGIFLLAALLFRSFSMGLVTIIPVTLATVLIAGCAGFIGIPIDVSTTLATGVAIGVGVDYAIHYIFRYRRERQKTDDHRIATLGTLRSVGKTIVFNAMIVTVGFLVLFFSQFPPNQKLGYFVAAYMVVSCLAALMALPVVFAYFKPRLSQGKHQGVV
ncbi:MAG: MMPL family transporter [Gammaproteobacteria bacterium]